MEENKIAEVLGKILLLSREIDTVKGDNKKLQKILGEKLYFQKGGKWYYNIEELRTKNIQILEQIADKIKAAV